MGHTAWRITQIDEQLETITVQIDELDDQLYDLKGERDQVNDQIGEAQRDRDKLATRSRELVDEMAELRLKWEEA